MVGSAGKASWTLRAPSESSAPARYRRTALERSLLGSGAGGAGPRQTRKYTSSVLRVRQTPIARSPAETGLVSRRSTCRRTERAIAILLPTLPPDGQRKVSGRLDPHG